MYNSPMIFFTLVPQLSDGQLLDIIFMNVVYACPLSRQGKRCVTSFSQNCDLVESAVEVSHFYQVDTDLLCVCFALLSIII